MKDVDNIRWKATRLAMLWTKFFRERGQTVNNTRRQRIEDAIDYILRGA